MWLGCLTLHVGMRHFLTLLQRRVRSYELMMMALLSQLIIACSTASGASFARYVVSPSDSTVPLVVVHAQIRKEAAQAAADFAAQVKAAQTEKDRGARQLEQANGKVRCYSLYHNKRKHDGTFYV